MALTGFRAWPVFRRRQAPWQPERHSKVRGCESSVFCSAWVPPSLGTIDSPADETGQAPNVVLLGDSIRLGYAPLVENELSGKAVVISPKANGGDSNNLRSTSMNGQSGAASHRPFQLRHPRYEEGEGRGNSRSPRSVRGQLAEFRRANPQGDEGNRPLRDDNTDPGRAGRQGQGECGVRSLPEASVEQYNGIAKKVMQDLKVPVNDLHGLCANPGRRVSGDGVHFTAEGQKMLNKAVAAFIEKHLPAKEK